MGVAVGVGLAVGVSVGVSVAVGLAVGVGVSVGAAATGGCPRVGVSPAVGAWVVGGDAGSALAGGRPKALLRSNSQPVSDSAASPSRTPMRTYIQMGAFFSTTTGSARAGRNARRRACENAPAVG